MTNKHAVGSLLRAGAIGLACSCLTWAGCGKPSLQTVLVKGKVTYQGNPLRGGTITFHPVDRQKGRPATATIGADGTYDVSTLETARGLVPGEYKICVTSQQESLAMMSPAEAARAAAKSLAIPQRYTNPETSGLSVTVAEGDGAKTLGLELVD